MAFSASNPQALADFREGENDSAVVFEKAKSVSADRFAPEHEKRTRVRI